VLKGIAYHLTAAGALVTVAADKEQGVGVFLFVLLASLSIGLAVSGVRDLLIDAPLRWKIRGKQLVAPLALDWSKVKDTNLAILLTIRDNHYRYFQFYSNTAVALVLWSLLYHFSSEQDLSALTWISLAVVVGLLLWAAKRALTRYVQAVKELLQ
jgi:hypothetical protein